MVKHVVRKGEVYRKWTVLKGASGALGMAFCRCECGTKRAVRVRTLTTGGSSYGISCGCHRGNRHGLTHHPLYQAWCSMRKRCSNPNNKHWADYGGRGIRVCKRWDDFAVFLADVGERPGPGYTLDRYPDKDGNYEPGNVRWATPSEQARNQRRPRKNVRLRALEELLERHPELRAEFDAIKSSLP